MKQEKIALGETGKFSPIFLDYLNGKHELKEFYNASPEVESFGAQLKSRSFPKGHRQALVTTLKEQYEGLTLSEKTAANLDSLLDENTFTVTTGHQLNIFTGPLYFIYKLVTVINSCQELKKKYPQHNFVPVYWMASEDHDFEEIRHFSLFGQRYEWESDQKGAVGHFDPSSLKQLLEELPEKPEVFEKAYLNNETLADAVRDYVNELFGEHGLVVVDADSRRLKKLFQPVIQEDVCYRKTQTLVNASTIRLEDNGYKSQIHPRKINFFYLDKNLRERIVYEEGKYKVLNTELSFTAEEITKLIDEEPEKFSPNVVTRPLYQETILPNLAYIGGPAEVAYWLQLKAAFSHYKIPFPLLMPRNFAMVINKTVGKKLDKLDLNKQLLFLKTDQLRKKFVEEHTDKPIALDEEQAALDQLYEKIKDKAQKIDQSLEGFIGAEASKALKGLTNIEKRLKKSEERNHETAIKQVESVKNKLFPDGKLQERSDNFLNFYINNPQFIEELIEAFEPFDYRFAILREDG